MQTYRRVGILIGFTVFSVVALGKEGAANDGQDPMSKMNGYTMGKALSGYYGDADQKRFVKGLLEGLKSADSPTIRDEAVGHAKQAWFNEPGLSSKERSSYAYGYLMGETYRQKGATVSPYALIQGLLDSLQNSGDPYVDREVGTAIVTKYQRAQYYRRKKAVADSIKAHERAGQAFLTSNAEQPGIRQTESGLQYRIISPGHGDNPVAEDTVTVTMVARTIDGQVFYDSNIDNQGNPTAIQVNKAIDGWQEALVMMAPGAEWEIFLPANLAYGNAGWQGRVDPGEMVIYRLKLLEVIPSRH